MATSWRRASLLHLTRTLPLRGGDHALDLLPDIGIVDETAGGQVAQPAQRLLHERTAVLHLVEHLGADDHRRRAPTLRHDHRPPRLRRAPQPARQIRAELLHGDEILLERGSLHRRSSVPNSVQLPRRRQATGRARAPPGTYPAPPPTNAAEGSASPGP